MERARTTTTWRPPRSRTSASARSAGSLRWLAGRLVARPPPPATLPRSAAVVVASPLTAADGAALAPDCAAKVIKMSPDAEFTLFRAGLARGGGLKEHDKRIDPKAVAVAASVGKLLADYVMQKTAKSATDAADGGSGGSAAPAARAATHSHRTLTYLGVSLVVRSFLNRVFKCEPARVGPRRRRGMLSIIMEPLKITPCLLVRHKYRHTNHHAAASLSLKVVPAPLGVGVAHDTNAT